MLTVLLYVVVTVLVAVALYLGSVAVFGRSEMLPPLTKGHTLTRLPEGEIQGDDVRDLSFQMVARGYSMREVDWALEQAAAEIDRLRGQLDPTEGSTARTATPPTAR